MRAAVPCSVEDGSVDDATMRADNPCQRVGNASRPVLLSSSRGKVAAVLLLALSVLLCPPSARSFMVHPFPQRLGMLRSGAGHATLLSTYASSTDEWQKARPITNGRYPAKDLCSRCGICDSFFVSKVKEACPFLEDGMSNIERMEEKVHGATRDAEDEDQLFFGVHQSHLLCRVSEPVEGAQWGGLVTTIACAMLESGMVDAVLCVASEELDPLSPKPILARTVSDILTSRGVKPILAPSLELLPLLLQDASISRLLACGVGCQVQALRAVEPLLGLEKLFVIGTNCVDNAPARTALTKFLHVASERPDSVVGYEFMPDYNVHLNHRGGGVEITPFFTLPAHELKDVIAPSCYACFDYSNALADIVVGYMSAPYQGGARMRESWQSVLVRNERGADMLRAAAHKLRVTDNTSGEGREGGGGGVVERMLVRTTVESDDAATLGELTPLAPHGWGAPKWVGLVIGGILGRVGPSGAGFGRYSIGYHYVRNSLFVRRHKGAAGARQHTPAHAQRIVDKYFSEEEMAAKAALRVSGTVGGVQAVPHQEWSLDRARAASLVKAELGPAGSAWERWLQQSVASALGVPTESWRGVGEEGRGQADARGSESAEEKDAA